MFRVTMFLAITTLLMVPQAAAQESSADIVFWKDGGDINVRVSVAALLEGRGLMKSLDDGETIVGLDWQGPGPNYVEADVDKHATWVFLKDLPTGSRCDNGDVKVKGLVRGNFIAVTSKGRDIFFNITAWDVEPDSCVISGEERQVSGGICRDQFVVTAACLSTRE